MASKDWQAYAHTYFKRFASPVPILDAPPTDCTQLIIVIPCHNEPDLMGTLKSLAACEPIGQPVEVIVVVNQAVNAPSEINAQNRQTIQDFDHWREGQDMKELSFHLIEALDLPPRQAGVGLARKVGMDEALRRFHGLGTEGTIVCLDADCQVSPNYLTAIYSEFHQSKAGIGEVYYEHDFANETAIDLRRGIILYELFLRYYVEGLRQAGFPNAIQTVGSCMLVKASVYAKHGGMNKRKAGEDFYFLHKIVPHELFKTVTPATVYPSCRTSDRVPFGTGKAQQDWLNQADHGYLTYDPQIFIELKALLRLAPSFFLEHLDVVLKRLSQANQDFLTAHRFLDKIKLIKANNTDPNQFVKQFFTWFDGFLCVKYVHYLRDHYYPNKPIGEVAAALINAETQDPLSLLKKYRLIDRLG